MASSALEDVEYVVARLRKLLNRRAGSGGPGVIFLLGAGCSRQYGLPGFQDLLAAIYEDCYERLPDPAWSFEVLRSKLDGHWQTLGLAERKELLGRFLRNICGAQCPGYRRLAKVCGEAKGQVRIIVNMNFDLLLEQALQAEEIPYTVNTHFPSPPQDGDPLVIVKPHGSIGDLGPWSPPTGPGGGAAKPAGGTRPQEPNELILDIASSDLFALAAEQTKAQEFFTENHVVSLGYSGVDAKIASALGNFPQELEPRERKLFFVNGERADPRLFSVVAKRTSEGLLVTGEEGGFESFLESLHPSPQPPDPGVRPRASLFPELTFMTRSEREALSRCLRLAQSIRAAINVADRSEKSIEEHGHDLYKLCQQLAAGSCLCLTPPERYVLYAAAFLHDLGYFAAYSDGTAVEQGWSLLTGEHGRKTDELVRQRLKDEPTLARELVPYREDETNRRKILGALLFICRAHSAYDEPHVESSLAPRESGDWDLPDPRADQTIRIAGGDVPLRNNLLQALFATAEELVKSHPFLPSIDAVVAKDENRYAIEDPVLDFYLRQKPDEMTFKVQGRRVLAQSHGDSPETEKLLLTMAWSVLTRYNAIATQAPAMARTCAGPSPSPCLFPLKLHLNDAKEPTPDCTEAPEMLLKSAFGEKLREALDGVWIDFESDMGELVSVVLRELSQLETAEGGAKRRLLAARRAMGTLEFPMTWMRETGGLLRRMAESANGAPSPDLASSLKLDLDVLRRALGRVWSPQDADVSLAGVQAALGDLETALEEIPIDGLAVVRARLKDLRERFLKARNAWRRRMVAEFENMLSLVEHVAETGRGSRLWRRLRWLRGSLDAYSASEVASILDVIAIYALPEGGREPRVELRDDAIAQSIDRIDVLAGIRQDGLRRDHRLSNHGLLPLYLPLAVARQETPDGTAEMEGWFCTSFEEIIYPAWRFFARNWHDNIEPVLMARACLDLGSSRFRAEVVSGVRSLLEKKVECSPGKSGAHAHGHDCCMLCTSRLLYIFSYARRLFPRDELKIFQRATGGRGLAETIGGILRHLCDLPPDSPAWWGILPKSEQPSQAEPGCETAGGERVIRSADYLSWAARSLSFCFAVAREVRTRTGHDWIEELDPAVSRELPRLLRQRWGQVFEATPQDLLSPQSEEPHSFILGHVALAYRELRLLREHYPELGLPELESKEVEFQKAFMQAYRKHMSFGPNTGAALLSRLYLWPASILHIDLLAEELEPRRRSRRAAGKEKRAARSRGEAALELARNRQEMVDLCCECVASPVWIRRDRLDQEGPPKVERDAGSWGFNIKNTQTVVTSLATFWRHAFDSRHFHDYRRLFDEHAGNGSARRPA